MSTGDGRASPQLSQYQPALSPIIVIITVISSQHIVLGFYVSLFRRSLLFHLGWFSSPVIVPAPSTSHLCSPPSSPALPRSIPSSLAILHCSHQSAHNGWRIGRLLSSIVVAG